MLEGVSAVAKPPGRWTDEKLANALTEAYRPNFPYAANTIGGWRKGTTLPESIIPLIAVFFGDSKSPSAEEKSFRDLFSQAQLEKWGPLKAKATDRAAPAFVAQGRTHVIDRAPRQTDARAARDPKLTALQANVRRSAERLAANVEARGQRYSNTPIWRECAREVRRLAEIAALEPQDLVLKLSDAYDASLYLGGRLDLDDRIRAGQSEDPPLDLDVRGDLAHLVRLAAPWLRNFPSIRKLDDLAAVSLGDFADTASAIRVIETAAQEQAIGPEDEQAMRTLAQASEDPEFVGRKAARRLVGGAGNLALSLAVTEAELQADGLDLSKTDVRALAASTRATLIKAGVDIDRLPLPEDVRAALRTLTAEAIAQPVRSATLPDDVEARARELILKGIAPPASWRPCIRKLDFDQSDLTDATPLAGLTALTELTLWGTQIADATPLAGLTALTELDISYTQIADATPLAGLTALTELNLSVTKIADATPLAALTGLTELALSRTQIADATPLAGLTALTELALWGTQITDMTPLGGLTGLTELNLSGTQIADATPLAGLTALTELDLSFTQIADATPLAGLTALTELDLSVTQITDMTPLGGLTALTELALWGTQIADATPLAGLTALTELDLSFTQIADATPLAGLTGLTELNLSGTQIADATPLAGLTALTELDLSVTQITDMTPLGGLTGLTRLVPPDAPVPDSSP
jgi:internalin A